jgi:hypothetical protein
MAALCAVPSGGLRHARRGGTLLGAAAAGVGSGPAWAASFWATMRGLSPAWMARMAASARWRSLASAASLLLRLAETGSHRMLAAPTPKRVAMKAVAIDSPRPEGSARLENADQAHDGSEDAEGGRVAAHLGEHVDALHVAGLHRLDLDHEDVFDGVRLEAVDDHLEAVADERILDPLDVTSRASRPSRRARSANLMSISRIWRCR